VKESKVGLVLQRKAARVSEPLGFAVPFKVAVVPPMSDALRVVAIGAGVPVKSLPEPGIAQYY
jgi:hypothetical protein